MPHGPLAPAGESGVPPAAARPMASLEEAYDALHHGAVLLDRSHRSRGRFSGPKAAETLTGLVTNDVVALKPGHGQYAAALTPKGKVIADVRIFARSDALLVDVAEAAAAGWWAMIRKYVNPRLAKYADVSAETCDLGVFGPRAREVVSRTLSIEWERLGALGMYAHLESEFGEHRVMVARVPDLGVEGYDLLAPRSAHDALCTALCTASGTHSALAAPAELATVARIEAGRPEWGVDMDETTLAQEANMEALGAVSFSKGCYTGQETVARVHFRGHVNRHLRGIRFDAEVPVPRGAELLDDTGRSVGEVRSSALSPRSGRIALAMVRREVDAGAHLTAQWSEGRVGATVAELPLPPA